MILLMRLVYVLFLCFFAATASAEVVFTDEEKAWLAKNPVITMCVHTNYEPIEFQKNGIHTGITGEYYQLIAKNIGVTFKLVKNKHWNECLDMVKQGKVDIISITKKTPEREKYLNFTGQIIDDDVVIITRQSDRMFGEIDIDDLKGKKVAVVDGYFYEELLAREYPKVLTEKVNTTQEGMMSVAFGKTDAFFSNLPVISYQTHEFGIDNLEVSGITPYKTDYRIGVRKDLELLPSILQKGFDEISPVTKRNIFHKWIRLNYHTPWYNKRLVYAVLLFGLGALGGMLVWSLKLSREVGKKTKALRESNEHLEKLVAERTKALELSNQKLYELSHQDNLTGLANRRYLETEFNKMLANDISKNQSIAICMVDVDCFKRYNDQYGHIQGDNTLSDVARSLKYIADTHGGMAVRYGGEEFTCVFPNISLASAESACEKIVLDIEALGITHATSTVSNVITVSVGCAWYDSLNGLTLKSAVDEADRLLYYAKNQGRNNYKINAVDTKLS